MKIVRLIRDFNFTKAFELLKVRGKNRLKEFLSCCYHLVLLYSNYSVYYYYY